MKTSELTGALLDYWVAQAGGSLDAKVEDWGALGTICVSSHGAFEPVPFHPSTSWSQCGPLIEKYKIVEILRDHHDQWSALSCHGASMICSEGFGATPQEAICRDVVQSVYGDEVPDE